MTDAAFDSTRFRTVLGQFATGVTVVTAVADGVPVGFACQSFAALSLDPPLVTFCPGRLSRAWAAIRSSGRFCVNVLADHQRDVSSVFGSRAEDKFAGLTWFPSPGGSPVLDGVLTWVDCVIEDVHSGGDHDIVVGRVQTLGQLGHERPLLFYRGAYTSVDLGDTGPAPERTDLEAFLTWPRHDDWV
ncbi:3-hydroxy-9,10-secoandrosta-1,3,5(10)-triene-9,17-dione monooxygenase reductase subunit [Rhodococcus sp. X156]|uniref:3-hydroxy-9,10-secoandrosta-1,3,5(10)-triene-9, 17-dione monooxygenase reductase subunit n=1 Tax=Rhodococcus sp. X156 TaxID=2499145 RepID=UPI0019D1698A|nr:3-hydroxy-9,10-secoandrosta-1,3,5(10)-triene-9,17-dione monooxygenase reductase subunit [Rhodococcus sp. X156]